jgi:hypothetical protein
MNITRSGLACLAALTVAAGCLSAVVALPAAATTRDFTAFGISRQNALGAATLECIGAGFTTAQCTLISDRPTSPGDDTWVAVVEGNN